MNSARAVTLTSIAVLLVGSIAVAQPSGLTTAERGAPTLESTPAGPRWFHRPLGIELPDMPGLTLTPNDPQLTATLAADPTQSAHMAAWRWTGTAAQLLVIVDVEPLMPAAARASYIDGMIVGARSTFSPPGFTALAETVRSPTDRMLRSQGPAGTGGLSLRIFSYEHAGRVVFASVMVAGTDMPALELLATSVRGH